MKYLLDSNMLVYLMRKPTYKRKMIVDKLNVVGWDNCFISEYTLFELFYGAFCSDRPEVNVEKVKFFCKDFQIIPISSICLDFAKQKALLKKRGWMIEDADIFIGSTAIANNMVMVTENINHMSRLEGIVIDNWCSGADFIN